MAEDGTLVTLKSLPGLARPARQLLIQSASEMDKASQVLVVGKDSDPGLRPMLGAHQHTGICMRQGARSNLPRIGAA